MGNTHTPSHPGPPQTKPRLRVTDRDLEVFRFVEDYQVLSTSQFRKLLFPSLSRTQKRLRALSDAGLIRRFKRAVMFGTGSAEDLWLPTKKGIQLANSYHTRAKSNGVGSYRRGSYSELFLDHTLARNQFRVDLEVAVRQTSGATSMKWRQGSEISVSVYGVIGNPPRLDRVTLVPDGLMDLQSSGSGTSFAVEIDRGTCTLGRLCKKLEFYRRFYEQITEKLQCNHNSLRILVVTTNCKRCQSVRRKLQSSIPASGGVDDLIWFTCLDCMSRDAGGVLSQEWITVHGKRKQLVGDLK